MIKKRYHFMKTIILMVILSVLLSQTYLTVPATTRTNVKKVTLDTKAITLKEGQSQTLNATIIPANATNKRIRWSSSDTDIVTVTSGGKVFAKEEGRAIITAKATNGKKAMCKVTVKAIGEVTKISLSKHDLTLDIDDNYQLEATITPANVSEEELTWYSSNEDVASVDDEGNVFPMGEGTTIITAEADNGVSDSCTITVTEKSDIDSEINLNTDSVSLKVGDNAKLNATITPSEGNDGFISWDSNDTDIVKVDSNGNVKAMAEGSAVITATLSNGNCDTCQINVSSGVIIATKILISRESSSLNVGDQLTLIATVEPANATDKGVKWISSNKTIASVDNSGIVTANAQGNAVITATNNGLSASCNVTVSLKTIAVNSITLSESNIPLNVTDMTSLTADVLPTNATDKSVTWQSSNSGIASVDSSGNIKALAQGTATITASSSNGKTASCTVTVTEPVNNNPNRVTIIDSTYSIKLKDSIVCVDVSAGETANGTNVQVWEQNNTNAQIWRFENHSDGTASIIAQCATDKVLDVMRTNNSTSGALNAGCNVDIYAHNDPDAQNFYVDQFSDGSCLIRLSTNPNLVVTATGKGSGDNVILDTYDVNNGLQRWIITPINGETKRNAYVYNTGGQGLIVRSGSSTSSSNIGGFTEGQTITVIGDIQNGWYHVEGIDRNTGNTVNGYSNGDYITFTQDSFQSKINVEMIKFPQGAYWNHIGESNNPDGYTWTPCGEDHTDDNCFSNAWQCHGFALKLGYDIFGSDPRTWNKVYTLDNIHQGDIIRYTKNGNPHSVFVTAVSGDTITIADCNSDFHCVIRWNHQMKKSSITGLNYVLTSPN